MKMNESIFNTPSAKRALKLHEGRIQVAESLRKKRGLDTTFEQKLATATCLENTRKQIKALESLSYGSATQVSNVGQYKRFAMDMVATIIPNLIASDLVSVQAIDNRVGMINILEYQYGSDKGAARMGQTFSSPLGYQGTDVDYTSAKITHEPVDVLNEDGSYTPKWTPIRGKGYVIGADGPQELTVDENGNFQGLVVGNEITYRYDNETVPVDAPTIKLNIKSLPVETKARKLKAIWSFDSAYELTKEYGSDMQQLLTTQATAKLLVA